MGYGKEYRYPHDHKGGKAEQDYLPPELSGQHFYEPGERDRKD
jgi:putative ATPase